MTSTSRRLATGAVSLAGAAAVNSAITVAPSVLRVKFT
jgi:hypothetical protein